MNIYVESIRFISNIYCISDKIQILTFHNYITY